MAHQLPRLALHPRRRLPSAPPPPDKAAAAAAAAEVPLSSTAAPGFDLRLRVRGVGLTVARDRCAGVLELDAPELAPAQSFAVAAAAAGGAAASTAAAPCRFCGAASVAAPGTGGPVCCDALCQAAAERACGAALPCGHPCGGAHAPGAAHGAAACGGLPCWEGCGGVAPPVPGDEYCAVCYADPLRDLPTVVLGGCGHALHLHCARRALQATTASGTL